MFLILLIIFLSISLFYGIGYYLAEKDDEKQFKKDETLKENTNLKKSSDNGNVFIKEPNQQKNTDPQPSEKSELIKDSKGTKKNPQQEIITESKIRKTSIKVKGVTYFDRQENLKKLYEQKLSKEDKHLRLEEFYLGNFQTYLVILNDLEIGTIPKEHVRMFQSPKYSYELSNIHIGAIKSENDNDIYFARLFVIFKEKQLK